MCEGEGKQKMQWIIIIILKIHIVYISFQSTGFLAAPRGYEPNIQWQQDQAAEFSDLRQRLGRHKTKLINQSSQNKPTLVRSFWWFILKRITLQLNFPALWYLKQIPIVSLTLTLHSPTKSNKGKWRKCAKSDYVIEAGLIWERNRCPGSDTRVACHGWTVHCGAGGPRFETQGEPPFFDPSLSEEIG